MANKDLRDWLAAVDTVGELKIIKGADPKEEIAESSIYINGKWATPRFCSMRCRASQRGSEF